MDDFKYDDFVRQGDIYTSSRGVWTVLTEPFRVERPDKFAVMVLSHDGKIGFFSSKRRLWIGFTRVKKIE